MASATITFEADGHYRLELACDVAALVMQAEPGHLTDRLADELRSLPQDELQALDTEASRSFQRGLKLDFDGQTFDRPQVEIPALATLLADLKPGAANQSAVIRATGTVPHGATRLAVRFPADIGPVALTVVRSGGEGTDAAQQLLAAGQTSQPILLNPAAEHSAAWTGPLAIAPQYLALGFEHILPYGADHILFVLGLFFLSPRWRPLLWQVTAFTVAHSISLALSSCRVISLPASVVEPLIALSIALVALENVFTTRLQPWRPAVVFGFGLVHGLGFAQVLEDTGLAHHDFFAALFAFNVGVELGQLAVIALAFLAVGWFRGRAWYRSRLAIPASCCIALAGLYWTAERLWFFRDL